MANVENTTIWRQIQQGVKETERLIGHRDYNLAMVKSRQTLECMVRCMAEKACVVEGDLSDTIDQLYEGRWITRNTRDHYHNIRILGNKAVHEGDDTAYDANQAFQLLVQEVQAFSSEYAGGGVRGGASRPAERRPSQARSASQGRAPARNSAQARRPSSSGQRHPSGKRKKKRKNVSPLYYVLRFLVPLLAVVLLIVVIKALMPGKEDKKETTAPSTVEVTTEAPSEPESTPAAEPETEPTEPVGGVYVITGSGVNVRKEPSKDGKILVQLPKGTTVEYVKRYSNDWAVINYDGQEAYVSSAFLERQEPETQSQAETAAP